MKGKKKGVEVRLRKKTMRRRSEDMMEDERREEVRFGEKKKGEEVKI